MEKKDAPTERVQLPDFSERTALLCSLERVGRHSRLDKAGKNGVLRGTTIISEGSRTSGQEGRTTRMLVPARV